METLIKVVQSMSEEAAGLAWVVLGILLPALLVLALLAWRWILRGGLGSGSEEFLARQHEIHRELTRDDW
jgi:hypothetical protein